ICERRRLRNDRRRIAIPERRVGRAAKGSSENAGARGILRNTSQKRRQSFDESAAVRADGGKKFGMAKSEMQGAVSAHGNAGCGGMREDGFHAELLFDARQKLLHQKIFIPNLSIVRIDVKSRPCRRRRDEKFAELFTLPQVFHEIPAAGMDEHLFVVAEA